ncbi:HNH endonuclease signature motif containing protein [uncultured Hoeflea sp.]|uniref:HNH endonuclease signature motif containing protein n=1 Tax=uncultured Hoeflea sp. TaxID=538666 RepID=UPI0030D9EBEF
MKAKRTRRTNIVYSADEMAWLEANQKLPIGEYHARFAGRFKRDDVSAANLHGLRKRKGWKTGRSGFFEKGAVPANKGKKMPFNANSAATRFKKGQLPHNFEGAGHERIDSKDGYVILIVDEVNPWTGAATRPVHKHRWLWERVNGPVPDGHALKCLDGDKLNTDPSNWEPVPRALLPRLSGRFGRGYDDAPAELKPTIMAVTKLEHAARAKAKNAGAGE